MKKSILIGLAVIIVAVLATFAIITFGSWSKVKSTERADIDDLFVCYINIEQLAAKGAFDQYLDVNNRQLIATATSANIEDKSMASYASAIITDLSASGLNVSTPAYCYIDEKGNIVGVIEVTDIDKVDLTAELAAYLIMQEAGKDIHLYREGENRFIEPDGNIIIAYNDTRLIVASNSAEYVSKELAMEALERPLLNLSIFGDSDIAYYVDCFKALNISRAQLEANKLKMQNSATPDIDELLGRLNEIAPYVSDKANAIISLNFEDGRMALRNKISGIDISTLGGATKVASNDHLNYIKVDAPIIFNCGINGAKLVEIINVVLDSHLFIESDYNTNEINMAIAIMCDALKSIDGDLTIAIEDIQGRTNYYGYPSLTNGAIAIMADVTDNYIISNLGQFTGGFLVRKDSTHYSGSFFGFKLSMSQDDGVFHAGINSTYDIKAPSALEARWFADVDGSISYLVVDIDALLDCSYIAAANTMFRNDLDPISQSLYTELIEACDYLYAAQNDSYSSEVVIMFKDKEENALKQLADIFMPVIMQELMPNI